MKKPWTKLWALADKMTPLRFGKRNYLHIDKLYCYLFIKHHQSACLLSFDRNGRPLEASYKCGDMRDQVSSEAKQHFEKTEGKELNEDT